MISLDEYIFSGKELLDTALSDHVILLLKAAIEKKGSAILVLSGGNTPKEMLEKLSTQKLEWSKVSVLLADERWVEPANNRSNEKMLRLHFLKNEAAVANFIGFYRPKITPETAPEYLEPHLSFLEETIDVLLLGMGDDGHTASLFPCAENIDTLLSSENAQKTVFVEPRNAPDQRISLSFPVLIAAQNVFVHFTGELKKEIFQKIISGCLDVPIGRVLNSSTGKKQLYWAS